MILKSQSVRPYWVKIHGHNSIEIRKQCHFHITGSDNTVDLFTVENGRLIRTASFNDVTSVQEADPPEAE